MICSIFIGPLEIEFKIWYSSNLFKVKARESIRIWISTSPFGGKDWEKGFYSKRNLEEFKYINILAQNHVNTYFEKKMENIPIRPVYSRKVDYTFLMLDQNRKEPVLSIRSQRQQEGLSSHPIFRLFQEILERIINH